MTKTATDKQQHACGERNPYFGVLGIESSDLSTAQVESSFYASGQAHIASVMEIICTHLGGLDRLGSALDFGYGVGRLVEPLSRRFEHVTGVDSSPAMIQLARKRLRDDPRVDFVERLDALYPTRGYDLVHSYIVIQHIRPEQGYSFIQAPIERVAPGGCFALHLTVGDLRTQRRQLNRLRYRLPLLRWGYNMAQLMRIMSGPYQGALSLVDFDQNGHVGVMFIGRRS